jgi:serine/threonine protein kinase
MMNASTLTIDRPVELHVAPLAPPPIPRPRRRRSRPMTLTPGMRIGPWRIERELGRGGMATVYAAVHTRFAKRAAVKLAHRDAIGPTLTPSAFLREARMANLIEHAGVTEVFATGSFDGRPYLAMERLAGRSLGAVLDASPIPRGEAIELLLELCDVLAAAHAAGVTHRDLKLDNVFVLDQPIGGRRIKLLDWGMAHVAGEPDPLRGLIAGTLTYVAPEQVRGDDITPAVDVYALGVLAYQLLLGQPPFASTSDLELLDKHLRDEPPRPRTIARDLPAALEPIMLAMLAKQPTERPALTDVVRALTAAKAPRTSWLADLIGRPRPTWWARRPFRLASAAFGIVLTVAGVAVTVIG